MSFNGATTFQLWICKNGVEMSNKDTMLQWGHNFSVMDVFGARNVSLFVKCASMGPQLFSYGYVTT